MLKNYLKTFVITVIILLTADANAKPWNNNTREHLFRTIAQHHQLNTSIQDEGFRWRNSFNFTINNQPISTENWWFNSIVLWNPVANLFSNRDGTGRIIDFINGTDANFIHSLLAMIANKVQQVNNCKSATTAAITIVIDNGGSYFAFSKLLCNDSNQIIVARTLKHTGTTNALISYTDFTAKDIRNAIETTLPIMDINIPNENKYSCSEGQIIAKIKLNNLELMKKTIMKLLIKARQLYGNAINYNNIKLVVLHIGTTMDPCAICTRCLVGLSKYINEDIDNLLRHTDQGAFNGNMNHSKFLVEVSSNGHYATATQYDTRGTRLAHDKQDNFAAFGFGNCSHTECAGHDGNENSTINVLMTDLMFPDIDNTVLIIPGGKISWRFNQHFPPYVVFGRVNNAYGIDKAPVYNANCGTSTRVHNARNNLPVIQ